MTEPVVGRKPLLALLMRLLWAAALLLPAFGAQAAVVFTTLHLFGLFPNGENPYGGLVQGSDGYFYGTTSSGGTNGSGTVFRISTDGALTALYSFTGGNDGVLPQSGLVQGSDGCFYGTTSGGGAYTNQYGEGYGTVFKISSSGALTSLYSFGSVQDTNGFPLDGAYPAAALVQGSDGYFYGTTSTGGTNNFGTVFKISSSGALTSLYSFGSVHDTNGFPLDGAYPAAALVQGSDGYFYGTTSGFGTSFLGWGTVFRISTNGVLTSLYSFFYGGGIRPSGLVQGSDGNFFGTTEYSYPGDWAFPPSGGGTVFKISSSGALTTLYSFTGTNDGMCPRAGLVQGSDGYFYGTTKYNDSENLVGTFSGAGTVFRISTNGVLTTLYAFGTVTNADGASLDGASPQAGLVQGSDGSFYGTTYYGGTGGSGTVFQISTNGVLTSLYSFGSVNDGANPSDSLVQGSDGNFYGTTEYGGTNGLGTVFRTSSNGALTSLYSFTGTNDGAIPVAGLVQGSDGSLYGTTYYGGTNNAGTVFKISTNGALTSLYSFTHGTDGEYPFLGLVQGTDGNFYGTTEGGGNTGGEYPFSPGTVFQISSNGALTTFYSFTGTNDGANPYAVLVQGSGGSFYGTTMFGGTNGYGTVFQISSNGALTTLHSFTGGNDGANPAVGLVQGNDGKMYGTTSDIETGGYGTVFKISTNGGLTTLYSFTGNDGSNPLAVLAQGSDGNFYGTTYGGGTNGWGAVFKISANGALTSLYAFTGGNDGGNPHAGLVQGSDGNFYGTTWMGGVGGAGTVFRLTIVPPPQLTIIPSEPYVILTWPTNYSGFTLQSTTNLGSSAVWTTNSPPPVVIGGDNVVINTMSGKQQFYRLSQ